MIFNGRLALSHAPDETSHKLGGAGKVAWRECPPSLQYANHLQRPRGKVHGSVWLRLCGTVAGDMNLDSIILDHHRSKTIN